MNGDFRGTSRFAIQRRLGAGGMGVVYEAHDRERQATVALKLLRSPTPDEILHLKREFDALQGLHHPNLVGLGELLEESGAWFYTMELIEGPDFVDYVRPHGGAGPSYDEKRLRNALAQLTCGLLALHESGKVHRDVKPTNILVDGDGRLVLLDFGLVAEPDISWSDYPAVGTAAYMAPEQAAGGWVGPEADWYSVGVVLYEALVGRAPFSGNDLQVLADKQRLLPPRPRTVVPDIPPDLEELCVELLAFDPDRRPTGRGILRRLGVTLQGRALGTPTTLASVTPFVDRDAELAFLAAALDEVRAGRQTIARIRGHDGMGKRTLIRTFAERAAADDRVVVLAGRCYDGRSAPYGGVGEIVNALSRYLARLPAQEMAGLVPAGASLLLEVFPMLHCIDALVDAPAQDIKDLQERRIRALGALRTLLAKLAETRTLILAIEDLGHADADQLAVLGELTHPPGAPAFLLVVSDEGGATSAWRPPAASLRELQLDPLSPAAARELAHALVSRIGGTAAMATTIDAIVHDAGGQPLLIEQLARAAAIATRGGAVGRRFTCIEDALAVRIQSLTTVSRRVLEVVAVGDDPIEVDIAARAAQIDPAVFAREVAALHIANLVRLTGDRGAELAAPYHARVGAAVRAHLAPDVRQSWHQALVRTLDATGRDALGIRLEHLLAAGDLEAAGTCAVEAAEQAAQVLAFDRAARLYEIALRHQPAGGTSERRLRIALGNSLAAAGRGAEAAKVYLAAAVGANAADALELRRHAAQRLLVAGHIDEGIAAMSELLAAEGLRYPKTPLSTLLSLATHMIRLRLRGGGFRERDASHLPAKELARVDACLSAAMSLVIVDAVRSHAFTVRALLLALRAGEPSRLARAMAAEVARHFSRSPRDTAWSDAILATAVELAGRGPDPHPLAYVTAVRGQNAYLRGRFRDGLRVCGQAEAILRERCVDVSSLVTIMMLWSCRTLYYLGEYATLAQRVPETLLECARRSDLYAATSLRVSVSPLVYLAADDVAQSRAEIAEALQGWSPAKFHLQHYYALVSKASADLYENQVRAAHDAVLATWPRLSRALLLRVHFVRVVMLDLRARCALAVASTAATAPSERATLLASATRDVRKIEHDGAPWADALARLVRAQIAAVRGDQDTARADLQAAVSQLDAVDMAMHAAVARWRLGDLLGGDEGRSLVATAEARMAEQKVVRAAGLVRILAPGLAPRREIGGGG